MSRVSRPLRSSVAVLVSAGGLTLLAGCEDKTDQPTTTTADSGAQTGPALEPELKEALKGATGKEGEAPPASGDGPPESGVFPPGAADKKIRAGAAPQVEVGKEGGAPRVQLKALLPAPGAKQKATARVAVRAGPQMALPTVDFDLQLSAKTPKDVEVAEGQRSPVDVIVKVAAARLAPTQPGAVPANVEKEIKKLKGSVVSYSISPNGAGRGFSYEMSKGADGGLNDVMSALLGAIQTTTLPVPDKPLGAGGFWMVTTRDRFLGADVVTYRLCTVAGVSPEGADITVGTKRYAADKQMPDAAGMEVFQFMVAGETELKLGGDAGYAPTAKVTDTTQILLLPAGAPPPQAGAMPPGMRPILQQSNVIIELAAKKN